MYRYCIGHSMCTVPTVASGWQCHRQSSLLTGFRRPGTRSSHVAKFISNAVRGPIRASHGGGHITTRRAVNNQQASKQRGTLQQTHAAAPGTATTGSAALGDNSTAIVRFYVTYEAGFGNYLKVCGSHEQLGAWDPRKAPTMEWGEGHVWTTAIQVPEGTEVEYKFVLVTGGGDVWEGGPNRSFELEKATFGAVPIVTVTCLWEDPDATDYDYTVEDGSAELAERMEAYDDGDDEDDPIVHLSPEQRSAIMEHEKDGLVAVTFSLPYQAGANECIKIVGNNKKLGKWELDEAPAMKFNPESGNWTFAARIPVATILEYKFVLITATGTNCWEGCDNRESDIVPPGPEELAAVQVNCLWNQEKKTTYDYIVVPEGMTRGAAASGLPVALRKKRSSEGDDLADYEDVDPSLRELSSALDKALRADEAVSDLLIEEVYRSQDLDSTLASMSESDDEGAEDDEDEDYLPELLSVQDPKTPTSKSASPLPKVVGSPGPAEAYGNGRVNINGAAQPKENLWGAMGNTPAPAPSQRPPPPAASNATAAPPTPEGARPPPGPSPAAAAFAAQQRAAALGQKPPQAPPQGTPVEGAVRAPPPPAGPAARGAPVRAPPGTSPRAPAGAPPRVQAGPQPVPGRGLAPATQPGTQGPIRTPLSIAPAAGKPLTGVATAASAALAQPVSAAVAPVQQPPKVEERQPSRATPPAVTDEPAVQETGNVAQQLEAEADAKPHRDIANVEQEAVQQSVEADSKEEVKADADVAAEEAVDNVVGDTTVDEAAEQIAAEEVSADAAVQEAKPSEDAVIEKAINEVTVSDVSEDIAATATESDFSTTEEIQGKKVPESATAEDVVAADAETEQPTDQEVSKPEDIHATAAVEAESAPAVADAPQAEQEVQQQETPNVLDQSLGEAEKGAEKLANETEQEAEPAPADNKALQQEQVAQVQQLTPPADSLDAESLAPATTAAAPSVPGSALQTPAKPAQSVPVWLRGGDGFEPSPLRQQASPAQGGPSGAPAPGVVEKERLDVAVAAALAALKGVSDLPPGLRDEDDSDGKEALRTVESPGAPEEVSPAAAALLEDVPAHARPSPEDLEDEEDTILEHASDALQQQQQDALTEAASPDQSGAPVAVSQGVESAAKQPGSAAASVEVVQATQVVVKGPVRVSDHSYSFQMDGIAAEVEEVRDGTVVYRFSDCNTAVTIRPPSRG